MAFNAERRGVVQGARLVHTRMERYGEAEGTTVT